MFYIENLPRIGTNDEYVDKINSYFLLIDNHDHFNIGNYVQGSSIDFTYLYLFNSIVNVDLTSFYAFNNDTIINTYTSDTFLFVKNEDLYFRKLNQTIRITQDSAVAVNLAEIGIKGDYNLYNIKTSYSGALQRYTFLANKNLSNMVCNTANFQILLTNKNDKNLNVFATVHNKPTLEFKQDFGYVTLNKNKQIEFSNKVINNDGIFSEYFIYNDFINILQPVFNRPTNTQNTSALIHYTDESSGTGYTFYYNTYLQFPYISNGDKELYYHVMGNTSNNLANPVELSLTLAKGSNTLVYEPRPFDSENYGSFLYFLNAKTKLNNVESYCDFMFVNGDLNDPLARSFIVNKIFMSAQENYTQKCIFAYYKP